MVDDAYLGEALFRLEGWVNLTEGAASAYDLESANVGLVYAQGPETRPLFITRGVETESWFPSGYAIDLYLPPPVEAYMEGPTGTPDEGIPVVVAVPVVWEDLDGDGKLGTDESVIGAPADVGVRWEPDNQQYALSGSMGCGVDPADYDPLELDLLVGAVFCEWIYDPDCDGRKDEWGPTCPPPAEGDTASPDPPE